MHTQCSRLFCTVLFLFPTSVRRNCHTRLPRSRAPSCTRTAYVRWRLAELRCWMPIRVHCSQCAGGFVHCDRPSSPSPNRFTAVDVDALPHLIFMLFPVAMSTVTGLFHVVGGLLIFPSALSIGICFGLIHSTHVTSSHNGYGILILVPGSFPSLFSILTCGVFPSLCLYLCWHYKTLHNMLSNLLGTTHIAEFHTLKRNVQHQRMTLAGKCMLWPELIGEAICPALQSREWDVFIYCLTLSYI